MNQILASDPGLDPDVFAGLMELVDDDDDGFIRDLFQSFVSSYQTCVEGMKQAIADANPSELKRHAHTLKGSSGNVGALAMSEFACNLQNLGESGAVDGGAEDIEGIESEFEKVYAELQEQIPGFSAN